MRIFSVLFLSAFLLLPAPSSLADATSDVQALIDEYCRLESDLAAQAKLMTDDRIMINAGRRQTDQANNMKVQIANAKVASELDPQGQVIATAVDPTIRVYGDTAVASFYRYWDYIPGAAFIKAMGGSAPPGPPPGIVTLVVVKRAGAWKIAHTHVSPLNPDN